MARPISWQASLPFGHRRRWGLPHAILAQGRCQCPCSGVAKRAFTRHRGCARIGALWSRRRLSWRRAMELEATLYTKEEGVATLTLNRPDTLNSITPRLIEEVTHALEDAERDAQVRAVVITGAGRGFCSGADMKGEGPGAQAAGLSPAERGNHLRAGPHP